MNYRQALSHLGQCRRLGVKLGLEKIEALAAALGSPHLRLRFIHIAGTNGKGSTAAFCSQALRGRGLKTGLFTSPHLLSIRERIQINGQPISQHDFASAYAEVQKAIEHLPLGQKSLAHDFTFFELLTAVAIHYFAKNKVEWVVWETGLGGRLDSTNFVTPVVCIITTIGHDHHEFLGPDLPSIAFEKAGILKRGVPAISGVEPDEAKAVIRHIAAERGAPLIEIDNNPAFFPHARVPVGRQQRVTIGGHSYPLSLFGVHQARNAACAVAALAQLPLPPFTPAELEIAFSKTNWPARFQILREDPPLVVDGGHNVDGITTSVAAWQGLHGQMKYHLVYGALAEKNPEKAAQLLLPFAQRISLVRPKSERALDPATLVPFFAPMPVQTYSSITEIWPDLIAQPEPTLIVGSLVLAGEALRLHHGTTDNEEEGQMNELLSPIR